MKNLITGSLVAIVMGFGATAVSADDHLSITPKEQVIIVEKNAHGKATKVRVGAQVYPVCMNEKMTDGCIQPRAAGLNWGPYPANYFKEKRS